MSGCPFHAATPREGLPPLTSRIATLPIDERGYPVPFFVGYIDGKPDFRVADRKKWLRCDRERLCWVCGQKLGRFVTFAIGPMCTINRTTADPPSHLDCAEWSVKGCPFLSRPHMVRREDRILGSHNRAVGGEMIERNPGVTVLWTVEVSTVRPKGYILFPDGEGRALIEIGVPSSVSWWREGRAATRRECLESIESGLPLLQAVCDQEVLATSRDAAHMELAQKTGVAVQYLPKDESRIILP